MVPRFLDLIARAVRRVGLRDLSDRLALRAWLIRTARRGGPPTYR